MKAIIFFLVLAVNHIARALVYDWVPTVDHTTGAAIDEALVVCESKETKKAFKRCIKKATKSFVRDGTLTAADVDAICEGLWTSCPYAEPSTGDTCRESQAGLYCNYYYTSVPVMDENGLCSGETSCTVTGGCNCMSGEWMCWTARRRRLSLMACQGGETPPDAFTSCTP
jgi:hypothetical protein